MSFSFLPLSKLCPESEFWVPEDNWHQDGQETHRARDDIEEQWAAHIHIGEHIVQSDVETLQPGGIVCT